MVWLVIWLTKIVLLVAAAYGEIIQSRFPDAALILSYAGFSGVCWTIVLRRVIRKRSPSALSNTSTGIMRASFVLLYVFWLASSISLFFMAHREVTQIGNEDSAAVLRGLGVLMIVVWCVALTQFRPNRADIWDYPQWYDDEPDRADKLPFRLGCAMIVVPAVMAVAAWFVMVLIWIS